MKTNFKSIAIVSLSLIVFNLSAQDFTTLQPLAQNHNEMALATALAKSTHGHSSMHRATWTDENTFAVYIQQQADEALHIESWMITAANFTVESRIQAEVEKPLELENWMTDPANFKIDLHIEQETDEPLQLTSWMMNSEIFDQSADLLITERDEQLEIKNWMLNSSLFQ